MTACRENSPTGLAQLRDCDTFLIYYFLNGCEYMKVIYLIYAVKCNIIRMKLFGVTLKLTSENLRLIKIENYDPKAFRKGRSIFIQGTI